MSEAKITKPGVDEPAGDSLVAQDGMHKGALDATVRVRVRTLPRKKTSKKTFQPEIVLFETVAARIAEALGGPDVIGPVDSLADLSMRVTDGLPYASFIILHKRLSLTRRELQKAVTISDRTLTRRKQEQQFAGDESDRLYRIARALAHATDVLESSEAAADWMRRTNRALGCSVPLDLLTTNAGAERVRIVLERIEYGVFS